MTNNKFLPRGMRLSLLGAALGLVIAPGLASAGAGAEFCNAGAITINASGAATPYPSTIAVAGQPAAVTDVNVRLIGMNHTWPDDIDILLVGPEGQNLIIMSDVGGSADLVNVDLTFDDAAAGLLPDESLIASGTYRPTNIGGSDTFPAPAPAPSAATTLGTFNGSNPNGNWSLYVVDDAAGDSGTITGGWCVQIAATTPVAPPNINVSPLALNASQGTNLTTQQALTIGNTGEADLTWAITEEPARVRVNGPMTQDDKARIEAARAALAGTPAGATGSRGGTPDLTPPDEAFRLTGSDFTEGFDDITALPGLGWFTQNNSSPVGSTGWFQGNDTVFAAHAGAPTAYIGANFNNTGDTGTISNWLVTPQVDLVNGASFSFWTRVPTGGASFPDRLELRLSTAGASTNVGTLPTDVGDFSTVLVSVNPALGAAYPETWTQFTVQLSGLPAAASGRFAFRYFVTDAGASGANSNYIGIDSVAYALPQVCDLPSNVPWLSVSPLNGTTTGGGSSNATVTFDSTGLAIGTYNANLCINSNDPTTGPGNGTARVIVPVQLDVVALPPVVSGTKTVSGSFFVGSNVSYTIVLTNTGAGPQNDNPGDEFVDVLPGGLTATSASASSGTVLRTGNTVTWNGSIPAGGSVTITIGATINPSAAGSVVTNQGTINFDSNADGTNNATVLTDDPGTAGAGDGTSFVARLVPPAFIPTLSQWGLLALIGIFGLLGWVGIRRSGA